MGRGNNEHGGEQYHKDIKRKAGWHNVCVKMNKNRKKEDSTNGPRDRGNRGRELHVVMRVQRLLLASYKTKRSDGGHLSITC